MTEKKPVGRRRRILQVMIVVVGAMLINSIFDPFGLRMQPGEMPTEQAESRPAIPLVEEIPRLRSPGNRNPRPPVEETEEEEVVPVPAPPSVPTLAELKEAGWDETLIPEHESEDELRTAYVTAARALCQLQNAEEPDPSAITNAENELVRLFFKIARPDPESTWGWRKRGFLRQLGFAGDDKAKLEKAFEGLLYKARYTDASNRGSAPCTTREKIEAQAKAFGWEGERQYRLFLQELFLTDKHLSRTGVAIFDEIGLWPQ